MRANTDLEYIRDRAAKLKKKAPPTFVEWVSGMYLGSNKFSFAGHLPLQGIYENIFQSTYLVLQKSVQLGASTLIVLYVFYLAIEMALKSIHYGPDDKFMQDFSKDRVFPIIDDNPAIAEQIHETNTALLKRIGRASVYWRGLQTSSKVASIDADAVFFDEFDIVKQDIGKEARDRLEHSKFGQEVYASKVTIPGYGVNGLFQDTNQNHWMIRCRCGHWNELTGRFPEIFKEKGDRVYFFCEKCDRELNPEKGQWIEKHPGRDKTGYLLSKLNFSFKVGKEQKTIARQAFDEWTGAKTLKERTRVRRSIAGIPYAGSMQRITDELLDTLHTDCEFMTSHPGPCYMGVDVGDLLYPVIAHPTGWGNQLQIHYMAAVDSFEEIDRLMLLHNVWFVGLELFPDRHKAKEFAKRHKGYCILVDIKDIRDDEKEDSVEKDGVKLPVMRMHREEAIDETVDQYEEKQFLLPRRASDRKVDLYRSHMKNLFKVEKEMPDGGKKHVYERNENHFGFSTNALRTAYKYTSIRPTALGLMPAGASFYSSGGHRAH